MAFEKRLPAVSPQLFMSNGTVDGVITVTNAALFKVKQEVVLTANSLPNLELQVKRVVSPNLVHVGPKAGNIDTRTDISSYTVALSSAIYANEQKRPSVPEQEVERLTYEEEPAVARRVIQIDRFGNPLKTDSSPDGSSLSVSVAQLSQDVEFTMGGEIKISDSLQGYAQGVEVQVSAVAVEAKGGPTRLSPRKGMFVYSINQGNYIGFANTVDSSNGIPIFQTQMIWIPASSDLQVWLVRSAGTGQVRVWEVG